MFNFLTLEKHSIGLDKLHHTTTHVQLGFFLVRLRTQSKASPKFRRGDKIVPHLNFAYTRTLADIIKTINNNMKQRIFSLITYFTKAYAYFFIFFLFIAVLDTLTSPQDFNFFSLITIVLIGTIAYLVGFRVKFVRMDNEGISFKHWRKEIKIPFTQIKQIRGGILPLTIIVHPKETSPYKKKVFFLGKLFPSVFIHPFRKHPTEKMLDEKIGKTF